LKKRIPETATGIF